MAFRDHLQTFWKKLISPKFRWGAFVMGVPMSYIAVRHVQWKHKPDSQKRMMIHHLVFWPLCIAGLKTMHLSFGMSGIRRVLGMAAASGTVIGGFEGGGRLAKKLVPKQPYLQSPINQSTPFNSNSPQQAYQAGFQAGLQAATQSRPKAQAGWVTSAPQSVYRLYR